MKPPFSVYFHMRNGDIFGEDIEPRSDDSCPEADHTNYLEQFKNTDHIFNGSREGQECYFRSSDVLYLEFCFMKVYKDEVD